MRIPTRVSRCFSGVLAGATSVATVAMLLSAGCKRNEAAAGTSPSASAAPGPVTVVSVAKPNSSVVAMSGGIPVPPELVTALNNPSSLPVYKGPTGVVVGKVTVKGDPPPPRTGPSPRGRCLGAASFYEKLFRAGPAGELADTVVGVTEYEAYVPARADHIDVDIRDCAFSQRIFALTFGQSISIKNHDSIESYLPHLDGARAPALMVAMPRGDAVNIYPPRPGRYMLLDDLKHPWMETEVLVFKFSTFAISDKDGRFRIDNVPVGKVKVSARHTAIEQTVERSVEIKDGATTEVNFEITYKKSDAPPPAPVKPRDQQMEIH